MWEGSRSMARPKRDQIRSCGSWWKEGADVNAKDKTGETPWSLAMSLNNDGELVRQSTADLLVKYRAKRLTTADFAKK